MTDKLSITFEGNDRDLLMSYGLLNELTKIVGSPEIAPQITVNHALREEILKAVLAERKPSGKIVKAIEDADDLDLSVEDAERVLDWATEAVLSFFVRSLDKMVRQAAENKDSLEALKSSLDGLQA